MYVYTVHVQLRIRIGMHVYTYTYMYTYLLMYGMPLPRVVLVHFACLQIPCRLVPYRSIPSCLDARSCLLVPYDHSQKPKLRWYVPSTLMRTYSLIQGFWKPWEGWLLKTRRQPRNWLGARCVLRFCWGSCADLLERHRPDRWQRAGLEVARI